MFWKGCCCNIRVSNSNFEAISIFYGAVVLPPTMKELVVQQIPLPPGSMRTLKTSKLDSCRRQGYQKDKGLFGEIYVLLALALSRCPMI